MDSLQEHTSFLKQVVELSPRRRKILIESASEEQLKVLAELFLNITQLSKTKMEQKRLSKLKTHIRYLTNHLQLEDVRKYLIKNQKVVKLVAATVLGKLLGGAITSLFECDGC